MHRPKCELDSRRLPGGHYVPLSEKRKLHCIAEVMEREGVTLDSAKRRIKMPASKAERQADATCDLLLSELYQWQELLQVPISDLVVEPDDSLSPNVVHRMRLLKTMKTVRAIQKQAQSEAIRTLAERLVEQLLEVMPELETVAAWNSVGERRTTEELGTAAKRCLPESFFEGNWDGDYVPR